MADSISNFPIPTKNILELEDAEAFNGTEVAEVIQNGNSRKFKPVNAVDAELLGAPKAQSPDPADDSNRIATTEWVQDELGSLSLTPDAPLPPTAPTLDQRTTLDQDGKVALFVVLGWTAPSNVKPRWTYEIRYTKAGADPDSHFVGDPGGKVRVESGVEYLFKVRTLSKDAKSDWLEFPAITPLKKSILPPAPTGLTANGQHKRVVLRWADPRVANPEYYDHSHTVIYRATSNNFLVAELLDRTASTAFVDGNLPNDTDYWYWIVHVDTSRNSSNKYPSSNTAGEHAKTNRITDDDTDDTAPGKPTNLVLTPRVERTDDGNLEVNLILTWDAPAGGLSSKGEYIYWIKESTSNDIHTGKADYDERRVKARFVRTNRTYDVKVRARLGVGKAGDWCDVVQITIGKKADYNTAVPSGLTVTTEHKRNVLAWDELTGLDALDYAFTKIYRATSNNFAAASVIGRPRDNAFIDGKVAINSQYWYWIAHVDRTRNEGVRFPLAPATNNGVTPGVSPQIIRADVADLAVDTDQMEYNSVTGLQNAGTSLKKFAHYPTTGNAAAEFGWGGNASNTKVNFNDILICESGPVKNNNPGPVNIVGAMLLVQDCTDTGYDGTFSAAGKSEVYTKLVLQYKRTGGSWKAVPKFKGPSCRDSAGRDDDLKRQKDQRSINLIHKPDVGDTYFYRVILTGYHRRGSDRNWDKADILASVSLKLQYTKR